MRIINIITKKTHNVSKNTITLTTFGFISIV